MKQKRLALIVLLFLVLLLAFSSLALAADYYTVIGEVPYTVYQQITITNNSSSPASAVTVTVPLPTEQDLAYSNQVGREFSPAADEIISHSNGQRYAVYYLGHMQGNSSVTLIQKFAATARAISYDYDELADYQYNAGELTRMSELLEPTELINSTHPDVISFAEDNTAGLTSVYEIARALFAAVNLHVDYSSGDAEQDALSVLYRRSGNCEGYSNLLLAAMRAKGVICRQVNGYLLQAAENTGSSREISNNAHSWVEFYLPETGWIIVDATFTNVFNSGNGVSKYVDWSFFSSVPSSRQYLLNTIGSTDQGEIAVSATGGQVDISFNVYLHNGHDYSPFNDITYHWGQSYVLFCYNNNLMKGVSTYQFLPDQNINRAMFVTVLGRLFELLGGQISYSLEEAGRFADVDTADYYANYLGWAVKNGLAQGYSESSFGVQDNITREQMTRLISNFVNYLGYALPQDAELNFVDAENISTWAREGVAKCSAAELVLGYENGAFYPQATATRAQAAAIFQRVYEWVMQQ